MPDRRNAARTILHAKENVDCPFMQLGSYRKQIWSCQRKVSELPTELPKTGFGVARAVFELKSELPKVGVGVANGVAKDSFLSCQSYFWSYRRLSLEIQKAVFGVTEGCFGSYRRLFLELRKAVF